MNLQEELKYLAGLTEADATDKAIGNFLQAFNEDVKEFGFEEAKKIYTVCYNLAELNEATEETYFSYLSEAGRIQLSGDDEESFAKAAVDKIASKAVTPTLGYSGTGGSNLGSQFRPPVPIPGFLSRIASSSLLQKIKTLFASGVSSFSKLLKSGKLGAIAASPIFKQILGVGSVGVAIWVARKLFKGHLDKQKEAALRVELQKVKGNK